MVCLNVNVSRHTDLDASEFSLISVASLTHTGKMSAKAKVLLVMLCVGITGVFLRGYLMSNITFEYPITCPCERCSVEDHQWFMDRFNKSQEPFLSAKYNLSENNFNWWKRLQREPGSFSHYTQTVRELFQFVPPRPDIMESSPDRCRSCAVVGNSGNLKRSHYGPLIDFHDVIIRMNTGKVKGYEADVGARTTHRIMYPESAVDLDNTTHLMLFPFKTLDLKWVKQALTTGFTGKSYMPVRTKITANKDLVMVVNPAFIRYIHERWLQKKGSYPSTGFIALVLALHICDEVHVFGFGADKDGNWSHYWEKLVNKRLKTGVHPGNQEYETILELAKLQKIQFFTGL